GGHGHIMGRSDDAGCGLRWRVRVRARLLRVRGLWWWEWVGWVGIGVELGGLGWLRGWCWRGDQWVAVAERSTRNGYGRDCGQLSGRGVIGGRGNAVVAFVGPYRGGGGRTAIGQAWV